MTKKILILGYGATGKEVAKLLAQRGDEVIVGQRTEPKDLFPGLKFVKVDVLNVNSFLESVKSVSTSIPFTDIVIALGFAYDHKVWAANWPKAMQNIIHVGEITKARLIFIDNLYMYGPQSVPLTEDLPLYSGSALKKPKVRADITRQWLTASNEHRVKFTALRAPDFYGPKCTLSHLGELVFPNIAQGKAPQFLVPLDIPHDFAYVPDIGRAAVVLIDADDDAFGQVWHVPCAPTRTVREIVAIAEKAAGLKKPPRASTVPFWLLPFVGLFMSFASEVKEMGFTWTTPYFVNADKFAKRFNFQATSFEEGIAETVKSFQ